MNNSINCNYSTSFQGGKSFPRNIKGAKVSDLARAVNKAIDHNNGRKKVTTNLLIKNNPGLSDEKGRISSEGAIALEKEYGTDFKTFIKNLVNLGKKFPDGDYSRLI